MDPGDVLRILKSDPPPGLPGKDLALRVIQENVYQVRTGGRQSLVKWITGQNTYGQNELRIGRLFKRYPVVPAPRMLFEITINEGVLAGWEWIEGHDLRMQEREYLIDAFAQLGELHRMLRNNGEVITPPNGARYATLAELLAAEGYRLTAPFDSNTRRRCVDVLARLEVGYPTLIHGDMHPGNILVTGSQVWFVDWSFACNSLNLFDLDYIHSTALPSTGPDWSVIEPQEAVLALPAYFQAAGLSEINYYQTHHAVMVWNLLRTYENGVKNGYRAELEAVRDQLQMLLDQANE